MNCSLSLRLRLLRTGIICSAIILCALLSLGRPAFAQSTQTTSSRIHSEKCSSLNDFNTLVAISVLIFDKTPNVPPPDLNFFDTLYNAVNRQEMYELLRDNSHNQSVIAASLFLGDISTYLTHRRKGDEIAVRDMVASKAFQARAIKMINIVNDICDASAMDGATGEDKSGQSLSGGSRSNKLAALKKKVSGLKVVLSMNEETRRLVNVFAILVGALSSLVMMNYAYRLVIALRLDRYNCTIPATTIIGSYEATGTINIVSRFGLSFVADLPKNPTHQKYFEIGADVVFVLKETQIATTQSIAFDGSAGFRINDVISKDMLKDILAQSKSYPYRRIERRSKRKPAAQNAPLVFKSQ